MSLPPGFLEELRARLSLGQVVGRKVMWDRRKSSEQKGDLWAPCPFHQEKTASFHVDDRKGFYYCFGCHAKGDAISFVRETENAGFMEAVEILAREAGMPMPARDPQAAERADRATKLVEVMEEAVRWLRLQLTRGAGAPARAYLTGRGLDEAQIDRWEIGYAPAGRQALYGALTERGIPPEALVEAGLCARPDDGGALYDRFRDRIIFPIRDARGRAIALGGRAMAPDARAKYLNSSETPLFDKGRTLFNHGPARAAAGLHTATGRAPLIVAEGYMDTVALVGAGFEATVAPLGTAITEHQLQLLWRMHPEPVIALDGDRAGREAAMRLVDLALPLLEAGRTLRFALLPDKQDPDDLIRAGGPAAMQARIDDSIPLVKMLWDREFGDGAGLDTPEAKAALDRRLSDAIRKIPDRTVGRYYADAIRELKYAAFRPRSWSPTAKSQGRRATVVTATAKASLLAGTIDAGAIEALRERVIVASLIANPAATTFFEYALEGFDFLHDGHRDLVGVLLRHWRSADADGMADEIAHGQGRDLHEAIIRDPMLSVVSATRRGASEDAIKTTVAEQLAKLEADRAARREIEESEEDIAGTATEALTWRLGQAAEARSRADRGETEDRTVWDVAANGVRLNREERTVFESMLRAAGIDAAPLDREVD